MKSILWVSITISMLAHGIAWSQTPLPAQEQAFVDLVSKYNQLDDQAPNNIQEERIRKQYAEALCKNIPTGYVKNWVGDLAQIKQDPYGSLYIIVDLNTSSMVTGSLALGLSVGNGYYFEIDPNRVSPGKAEPVQKGTEIYDSLINMPINDAEKILFSGKFLPFNSIQGCEDEAGYSTYFSIFDFSNVTDVGPDNG